MNNERSNAWRVFFRVQGHVNSILEATLKARLGLTLSDYHVLLALWEAEEHTLRMGQLADMVVFSPSRVSYLVTHLEKDGLVKRQPSSWDKRGFDATLTPEGERRFLVATRIHQELIREVVLADMGEEQINELVDLFARIEEQMNASDY
ncbi:MAG: MarR family transcriptional regulator [Actinomycetaceae bacterium]|nr:MarR family transcriptional regulator [Actinomycetaceae bacterium]